MKYIRTEDGRIIEIKYEMELVVGGMNIDDIFFANKDIMKQTDTIEELCDEFVCVRKDNLLNIKPALFNQDYDFNKEKEILKIRFEIYGAIWTDKGLIYVAKMNEKGELELL